MQGSAARRRGSAGQGQASFIRGGGGLLWMRPTDFGTPPPALLLL